MAKRSAANVVDGEGADADSSLHNSKRKKSQKSINPKDVTQSQPSTSKSVNHIRSSATQSSDSANNSVLHQLTSACSNNAPDQLHATANSSILSSTSSRGNRRSRNSLNSTRSSLNISQTERPNTRSRDKPADTDDEEEDMDNEESGNFECGDDTYGIEEKNLGIAPDEDEVHVELFKEAAKAYRRPVVEPVDDEEDGEEFDLAAFVLRLGFKSVDLLTTQTEPLADNDWKKEVLGKVVQLVPSYSKNTEAKGIKVILGNDEYHSHGLQFRSNKKLMHFRCKCRTRRSCDAAIKIDKTGKVVWSTGSHKVHCNDRIKAAYWDLVRKTAAENPLASSDEIYSLATEATTCPKNLLPKKATVKRALFDMRGVEIPSASKDPLNITLDGSVYANTKLFEKTFKSGHKFERLIALGTKISLRALAKSTELSCDGTFTTSSKHFRQLYIIHGRVAEEPEDFYIENNDDVRLRNSMRPLAYIFMTGKSQACYETMFKELQKAIKDETGEDWTGPERFMLDFELAVTNALKSVFGSNVKWQYCYFHYSQMLLKYCKKNKQLADLMKKDKKRGFNVYRRLQSLAHLPPSRIQEGFTALVNDPRMKIASSVLLHLKKFYIGSKTAKKPVRFPYEFWSCYDANLNLENRTNNACESFNSRLNYDLHHKASFFSIVRKIELMLIDVERILERVEAGMGLEEMPNTDRYTRMIEKQRELREFLQTSSVMSIKTCIEFIVKNFSTKFTYKKNCISEDA